MILQKKAGGAGPLDPFYDRNWPDSQERPPSSVRTTRPPESRELIASPPRQGGNHQSVGMMSQLRHKLAAQAPIQIEGIPVALVHLKGLPPRIL